jgi:nicotinamide-nucleotide amidase
LMKLEVLPKIQKEFKLPFISHKTIMSYGQGETIIAERIAKVEDNLPSHIKLAYLPSFGKVRLRLSGTGNDKDVLESELQEKVTEIQQIISDIIVGLEDGYSIEKRVGALLIEQQKTLATAESLTGGSIASTLVSVPGASTYFKGSFITYSEDAKKSMLNVSENTINRFTVVSKEVAQEMATTTREKLKTDFAIAVTGNAGPTTDKTNKTVGVVFIALATETGVYVEEFNFGQPREKVINRTVNKSLEILQKELLKNNENSFVR